MHSVHAHKANEMGYEAIIFQGSDQIFFKNIRFDYFQLVTDLVYCNIGRTRLGASGRMIQIVRCK